MLRYCCLCDCFGGCRKRKRDSEPLDPEAVNRCVERLRAHEETQKGRHVSLFNNIPNFYMHSSLNSSI